MGKKKKHTTSIGTETDNEGLVSGSIAVPPANELAKPQETKNAPGLENIDSADIIIPRLSLVQAMSDGVDFDDENAPKPGQWMHSLTSECFTGPQLVVPIFYNKAAAKFGESPGDPIECRSPDGKDGNFFGLCAHCDHNYAKWVNDEAPACTAIHQFVCVMADDEPSEATPFIVSMMKTGSKTAQKWISAAKFAKKELFAVKYNLDRDKVNGAKGDYYVPTIKAAGQIDPEPYRMLYEMMADAYKSGAIKDEVEDVFKAEETDGEDAPF